MAVNLPDQCPSSVRYTPPAHPVRGFRSQSGATYRVLFGSLSSGAGLELEYLLSNQEAALWMEAFEAARGEFFEVLVDDTRWAGADGLAATVPAHIRWHFAEPPRLERVFANRARLAVTLTGDLEAG